MAGPGEIDIPLTPHSAGGDAQTIVDTAVATVRPVKLSPLEVYAFRVGSHLDVVDPEKYGLHPRRSKGSVNVHTLASLVEYVKQHEDVDGRSTVWVDLLAARAVAVLNDHDPKAAVQPGWRDHRAELAFTRTEPWQHWLKLDGDLVDQQAFSEHLEFGMTEILEPSGAVMLELAQSFNATTQSTFRSARKLASGEVKLQYDEDVKATAGSAAGEATVPNEFKLLVAPFVGDEPVQVTAKLRFRAGGGSLALGYQLERPKEVERASLERSFDALNEEFAHVYLGQPA